MQIELRPPADIKRPPRLAGYEAHKERARERQAEQSRSGRDIGEIPEVAFPQRRLAAEFSLWDFCLSYLPNDFYWGWSGDHTRILYLIETVVLRGGTFANAMPRGSGKTSLCEAAALWALLYGHRPYIAVIGPDQRHAEQRIENLQTNLEVNDRLLEDFPAVCYPIRRLEGINQRRLLYRGKMIRMEFTANRIILPVIPGSAAAGGIVATAGITGQIRGLLIKRADGTSVRPSLVLLDDPQTDESAASPSQCVQRERIINGAVLGLAGPGARIAAIMPCTVIRPDDLADRMLDRTRNPQWRGERTKMVYAWPTNEDLWKQYAEIRRHAQREYADDTPAIDVACNEFYLANRAAMDEGGRVAWEHRKEPGDVSALQHAWNLRIDRKDPAFFAEYQNEPLPEDQVDTDLLSPDEIAAKLNGSARAEVPAGCTSLTMFIDVMAKALYWVAVAWKPDFTGYIVDYGTEPDQKSDYFALADIRRTLALTSPRAGLEGQIYAGLERLAERTVGREWRRADGGVARVDRCLIDAKWGLSTDVVHQFCRQSKFANVLMPSIGIGITASGRPMSDWPKRDGERRGHNWLIRPSRAIRQVLIDVNFWKSFVHARLAVAMGDPGCLSLCGESSDRHRLIAEHLTSEYRVKTEGRGRSIEEWKIRADNVDNHWLDGVVGCAVGASIVGALLPTMEPVATKRKRVSFAEMQAKARGLRAG